MVIEGVVKVLGEAAKESLKLAKTLDKPLNLNDVKAAFSKDFKLKDQLKELDKPLNSKEEVKKDSEVQKIAGQEAEKVEKIEKMEPPIEIEFKCPEGMDKKEFTRQIKAQERGLNSQTVLENRNNRAAFEQRKLESGNGRDLESGKKAQDIARQKASQSRIESNQKKGMSYSEAKTEAEAWMKNQAALHNPDQIAGGDPAKVSRMGDANINSSIGSQWRTRVDKLKEGVDDFAKNKSAEELANIKMNVKLTVV